MIEYGKLEKLNEAPAAGQYLIYTRKAVLFAAYTSMAEVDAILQNPENEILEIHLFDAEKEYRAVATSSKRYPKGVIEYVSKISDKDDTEIYVDQTLLDKEYADTSGQKILNVLNHIRYGENGMISIDDYRLVMGGVK